MMALRMLISSHFRRLVLPFALAFLPRSRVSFAGWFAPVSTFGRTFHFAKFSTQTDPNLSHRGTPCWLCRVSAIVAPSRRSRCNVRSTYLFANSVGESASAHRSSVKWLRGIKIIKSMVLKLLYQLFNNQDGLENFSNDFTCRRWTEFYKFVPPTLKHSSVILFLHIPVLGYSGIDYRKSVCYLETVISYGRTRDWFFKARISTGMMLQTLVIRVRRDTGPQFTMYNKYTWIWYLT